MSEHVKQLTGRPSKYNDDVQEAADHYVSNFQEYGDLVPTVVGLALVCDVVAKTIYNWATEENPKFLHTVSKIEMLQHRGLINGGLSEALPAMANQLIADIKATPFNEQMDAGVRHVGATNDWYITAPRKFVNDWIFKTYSRSEMAMHAPKVGELLKLISADGLGKSSPVRIDQTVTRLLKIK